MTDLRLVLLVAGALALLVVWLLDARRERRERRQHTILRPGHDSGNRISRADAEDPDYAGLPTISPRGEPGPVPEMTPSTPARANPEFIAIFVQSPAATLFPQARIVEAAEAAGLALDAQGIFHMPGAAPDGAPLFTMANLHEPGTFSRDPDARATRGLALIMRLPAPVDGPMALNLMLHTGELLANDLGGTLVDAARRPLDGAGIARLQRSVGTRDA